MRYVSAMREGVAGGSRLDDSSDDEGSLSWEDFFGGSSATDLVPSLLGMYDAMVAQRTSSAAAPPPPHHPLIPPSCGEQQRHQHHHHHQQQQHQQQQQEEEDEEEEEERGGDVEGVRRPLSVASSSSASSSTSSSSASSSSCDVAGSVGAEGRRGRRPKSSAYLASVESLGDDTAPPAAVGAGRTSSPRGGTLPPCHLRQQAGRRGLFAQAGCAKSVSAGSSSSAPTSCSHISAPTLPTGPRPRYCDPNLSYMDRVVMEIAETEAVYVRDLKQIIEGYLHRWRPSEECPIGSKQLKDLFGNIEDIFMFNSEFLCQLEQCGLDPVKVAKTFVKNNAGFSIYTDYCTNYPRTVSTLTELMRQDLTVRLFRERQVALQHTLPLGSYLLKPVQRILKYHLLLQNIVKHFGKESEGYRDIADALSAMTGIAHHINEMKRKHEHSIRVQEIQSLLYGWEGEDLTTFGELCAEGAFRMYGAKALRHAFLFDRMLLLTKRKEEGILMYKAHILCSNLMLIESVPGEPLSFHVIPFDNPRLQYTLQARNLEQKREWALQLKRVILENYNAVIPTHARQLVMQLGQNRTEDEILAEKSTPKRQHSAPEYLERRKHERRKSETGLLLRNRLRRSNRKDSSTCIADGMSSKEPSPLVQRRGRRAQSVCRDRQDSVSSSNGPLEGEGQREGTTADKVKDRFGSWRRKSEPSYLSKGAGRTSVGHLSIYVSPDFIERSSDSLADISREDETVSLASGHNEHDEIEPPAADVVSEDALDVAATEHLEGEGVKGGECTLEQIVGQLLLQSDHFQRMLTQRRQRRAHGARRRQQHAKEDDALPPPSGQPPPPANKFRAQREAHMRALREEQRQSVVREGGRRENDSGVSRADGECDVNHYDNLQGVWGVWPQGAEWRGEDPCHSLPRDWAPPSNQTDRPSSIASSSECRADEIDFEDIEQYMAETERGSTFLSPRFPLADGPDGDVADVEEDEEDAMEQVNVHPDYRIYRPSVSRTALRHVISSVSNKLANLRLSATSGGMTTDDEEGSEAYTLRRRRRGRSSCSPDSLNMLGGGSAVSGCDSESESGRGGWLVYTLARHCSRSLKERIRNIMTMSSSRLDLVQPLPSEGEGHPPEQRCVPPDANSATPPPYHKQGSSTLGARIAHGREVPEYATPNILGKVVVVNGCSRPDSLLSATSSAFTSSSDGDSKALSGVGASLVPESKAVPIPCSASAEDDDEEDDEYVGGSGDSYYERSFEAIELVVTDTNVGAVGDAFRDSAIFSDPEEATVGSGDPPETTAQPQTAIGGARRPKIPPPVPAKPSRAPSMPCVPCEGAAVPLLGVKSVRERRQELEKCRQSPLDATQGESAEGGATPKGWVRHVIGKLQGD
ncbi:uncharacterized protein LOC124166600 [Ischnura elegans]|uniref:uncharacterized protein LOC124166600 n=1 Tax=Ischnura elegans TaxID=197161 RepID=UPI001ED89178|nr:uncharacterized protein LOC124166600 [Ischnura elegans]